MKEMGADPQPTSKETLAAEVEICLAPLGGRTALAAYRVESHPRSVGAARRDHENRGVEPAPVERGTLLLRADDVFPAASLLKIGIAIEVLRRADLGQLSLDARLDTSAEPRVGGGGILDHLDPSTRLTVRE